MTVWVVSQIDVYQINQSNSKSTLHPHIKNKEEKAKQQVNYFFSRIDFSINPPRVDKTFTLPSISSGI